MLYVLTYTLRPKRDVTALATIIQQSPNWAHYIDDTWFISTSESIKVLYDRIRLFFRQTDSLLITELKFDTPYYGWLPKEAWDWIEQHRVG